MDARLHHLERVFRALADPTRLRIIGLLAGGEVCVCHIHESLRIPQPKTSRHLAYLRRAGLVETRRDGLWVHYRLAEPADATVRTVLNAAVHTLGHVPTAKTDQERLGRKAGRPPADRRMLPVLACCAGGAEAAR
jgi:ArsR family transcriptional regulator, arsenate/arsenite/antimonite-responsive transcriptional repressor